MNVDIIIAMMFSIIVIITVKFLDASKPTILICIISAIGYFLCVCNIDSDIPPIEVYRGNTELEITYKNDISIDSTVVWKNK